MYTTTAADTVRAAGRQGRPHLNRVMQHFKILNKLSDIRVYTYELNLILVVN